jgi:AraC-like DNA-binding protein
MREKLRISADLNGMVFNFRPLFQDFMTQPHQHAELELNLVTSGTAAYYFSDVQYTMRPGSMVWILPNQNHRLSQWSSDFSMDVAVFSRMPEDAAYSNLLQGGLNDEEFSRVMDHEVTQMMHQIFKSLYVRNKHNGGVETQAPIYARTVYGVGDNEVYSHQSPDVLNRGLEFLLTYAWEVFLRNGDVSESKKMHPAIYHSIQLIQEHAPSAESVRALSKACGLSESRFSKLFKEQMGMSVPAYKNRVKLDHFIHLLKSSNLTLTEACYAAEFGSYAQFHKVFKEHFKVSPKEYCFPER